MPRGYTKDGKPRAVSPEKRCAVCRHPERHRIEALHVAGRSLDKLSEQFGVSRDAVWRHVTRHMTDESKASYLVGAGKIAELAEIAAEENRSLVDYFGIVRSILFRHFDRVSKGNDHQGVALLSQRLVEVLREIGKVTGQISTLANSTVINVNFNSQILQSAPFADLESGLLELAARHPDIRPDVIDLFQRLDAKYARQITPATVIEHIAEAVHA